VSSLSLLVTSPVLQIEQEVTSKSTTLFLFRRIKELVIPDAKPAFSLHLLAERMFSI
jgi:hypothetical protein